LESKLYKTADYHAVRPTQESVNISIKKMDVPCVCPNPETDDTMRLTILYVCLYLKYATQTINPNRPFEINGSAAPGQPYPGTKADAIETPLFKELAPSVSHIPVDEVNVKHEELSIEDHMRKKCRTVFCTPVDFIVKEKILFDEQNKKIKEGNPHSFIKYGMVKQYGGFNAVFKKIQRFSLRFDSDCSGWDRRFFLLYVYLIRQKLTTNWMEFFSLWMYVSFFNIHSVILLPDGSIYIRSTGNDSGKNNTTVDNSIGHLIICFYFFIERLKFLKKEISLYAIIAYIELAIYSDDKTGSCDHEYWDFTIESFKEWEREIYSRFGLEIKPTQQLVTLGAAGSLIDPRHSFLGSYAYYREDYGMYVPFPRVGKICSSLINELPKLKNDLLFRRFLVLTTLLYPDKVLFEEAISLTKKFMDENPEDNAIFQCILEEENLNLETECEFTKLYLGFEANADSLLFFLESDSSITHELWKFEDFNGSTNHENSYKKDHSSRSVETKDKKKDGENNGQSTSNNETKTRYNHDSEGQTTNCSSYSSVCRQLRRSIVQPVEFRFGSMSSLRSPTSSL
jgi:hypothetical protein